MDEKSVMGAAYGAVAGAVATVFGYGKMHQRVKVLEEKAEHTEKTLDALKSDVSATRSDVSYIRGKLEGVVVQTSKDGDS